MGTKIGKKNWGELAENGNKMGEKGEGKFPYMDFAPPTFTYLGLDIPTFTYLGFSLAHIR